MIPSPALVSDPLGKQRGSRRLPVAPGSCHVAEQPVPMRDWISPRLQCLHSLSLSPSYQIKLTLVGDPYQFLGTGLGGGWQRHTQKALSLFVAVCLGFFGRGVWMISATGGTAGWTPLLTDSDPSILQRCHDKCEWFVTSPTVGQGMLFASQISHLGRAAACLEPGFVVLQRGCHSLSGFLTASLAAHLDRHE